MTETRIDCNQITVSDFEDQTKRDYFMKSVKRCEAFDQIKNELRFLVENDVCNSIDKLSLFYKQKFTNKLYECELTNNKIDFLFISNDMNKIEFSLRFLKFLSDPNSSNAIDIAFLLGESAFEYYKKDIEEILEELLQEKYKKITEFKS